MIGAKAGNCVARHSAIRIDLLTTALLFPSGAPMKSSFANHLVLVGALAVFAFAVFALRVNLNAAPEATAEIARSVK